jgi:peptide/nickel transport system substrate-binding protein
MAKSMRVFNRYLLALAMALPAAAHAAPPRILSSSALAQMPRRLIQLRSRAATFQYCQAHLRDAFQVNFEGQVEPYLVDKTTVSDDGLAYTFTIKQGLTCDDGEPLTAEDVAYSFNRPADKALGFTGNTPGFVYTTLGFKSAEAVDELNVTINLTAKTTLALGMMSQVFIHCKDSYEKMTLEEAASNPIGSGSYRLAAWDRGSQIVLEKVKDPGTFETIIWRIIRRHRPALPS